MGFIRISSNVPVNIYITYIFFNFLIETWFWSHPNSRGRCNFIIWLKSMRRPKMIFFSKTFTLLVASVWFGIKVMVNLNSSQINKKRTLLLLRIAFPMHYFLKRFLRYHSRSIFNFIVLISTKIISNFLIGVSLFFLELIHWQMILIYFSEADEVVNIRQEPSAKSDN